MGYNHSTNDSNYKDPFNSKLFQEGFTNEKTPLDEYNMNLILTAISKNKTNADNEESRRQALDKYITGIENINDKNADGSYEYDIDSDYENSNESLRTYINMLAKENLVSSTPTIDMTWKTNGGQFKGSYEAGTQVTLSYKITLKDGTYKYPNKDGSRDMGCTITDCTVTFGNNTIDDEVEGEFEPITVTENTNLECKVNATHSRGTIPYNKLGLADADYVQKSGTWSTRATVTGYRMGCFYGTVANDFSSLTSEMIRSLNKSNAAYKGGTITMNVPVGAEAIIIACPSDKTGPTNVLNTTVNAKMTTLFGKDNVYGRLQVKGANNDIGAFYDVWVYKPATPYESTASLTITLG